MQPECATAPGESAHDQDADDHWPASHCLSRVKESASSPVTMVVAPQPRLLALQVALERVEEKPIMWHRQPARGEHGGNEQVVSTGPPAGQAIQLPIV